MDGRKTPETAVRGGRARGRRAELLGEGRGARAVRSGRQFTATHGFEKQRLLDGTFSGGKTASLGGRAIEGMNDQALVGRMLER